MSALVPYESSSDEAEEDAEAMCISATVSDSATTTGTQFVRTFPHTVGQWATSVYLPVEGLDLSSLQEPMARTVTKHIPTSTAHKAIDEPHLSLSRTLPFRRHQLEAFQEHLQKSIKQQGIESFTIKFRDNLEVLTNDEGTRAFVTLRSNHLSDPSLVRLVNLVDTALEKYGFQDTYYEKPIFHVSLYSWATCTNPHLRSQNIEAISNDMNALAKELDLLNGIEINAHQIVVRCGTKQQVCIELNDADD